MKIFRIGLILLGLAGIFGLFGKQIKAMEELRVTGDIVLLKLAPVDPRAFMQGDYMALGYDGSTRPKNMDGLPPQGLAILTRDKDNIGTFLRLDSSAALQETEVRIKYVKKRWAASYGGERYFFQEGTAEVFEAAEYGVFKVSPSGQAMLVNLADKDFKLLDAP